MTDPYSTTSIKALFDEMSKTYGLVNMASSLGFAYSWRKKCVQKANITDATAHVCDLMTGSGECLTFIRRHCAPKTCISLVDISANMCSLAMRTCRRHRHSSAGVINGDALSLPLPSESVDSVVCNFGLKTLNPGQQADLLREIARILKPGGSYSLLEFTVPKNWIPRIPFTVYVRYIVPLVGMLFLGNPDNYRRLWYYTSRFSGCESLRPMLPANLTGHSTGYFFGSATHLYGTRAV